LTFSIGHPAGTPWPPPESPDAPLAVGQPSGAAAVRPYVQVAETARPSSVQAVARPSAAVARVVRPSLAVAARPSVQVAATARPSSMLAVARPSAAVEVPERRGLPAVVSALPPVRPTAAGLGAIPAAVEVSEQR
jgi:hypothetical protein